MVYVSLMRLIVVNYWSYVNNPIPDQAKRVIYVEKIQLEWMRFPLTIRIPNESRTAGISSPDEPRIVLTLKTDSLSRYGPRETLPSPIRPLGAAANLQEDWAAHPVCSEAAQVLHQCPAQLCLFSVENVCVSLIPHFSATCGSWLLAWSRSAPIFRPYLWVTLCLLSASKASLESGTVSFATEVALRMLLSRDFSSVLQNWCMYRKITENRAGRELKSPLQKVLPTDQNNSEKMILEFNMEKRFLSSTWLPKLIFKTSSGRRLYKELAPVLFLPQ